MRQWLYKTYESGRPRRFLSHRELLMWAARKVGGYLGPPLGLGVIAAIFVPQDLAREVFLWLSVMGLALCATAVAGIYLYVALSGGVMSAEQRAGYLERLRESRRGRWPEPHRLSAES